MTCSAVIPTRNRKEDLLRLVESLSKQTRVPEEIIIVDSSDEPVEQFLDGFAGPLNIRCLRSTPSACKQRNMGISSASGAFVLLCDDDMILPPDYVESMFSFLDSHRETGAISGLIAERFEDGKVRDYPPTSFMRLAWNSIFFLSLWCDLDSHDHAGITFPLFRLIHNNSFRIPNGMSTAGWPRITQGGPTSFRTQFYGLGASIIQKQWLIESPYDEILDESGIGDHYGVAMHFPGTRSITVLTTVRAFHAQSDSQRISDSLSSYRRILALAYFRRNDRLVRKIAFVWSLVGLLLSSCIRTDWNHARMLTKATWLILTASNPYQVAAMSGKSGPTNPE